MHFDSILTSMAATPRYMSNIQIYRSMTSIFYSNIPIPETHRYAHTGDIS